MIDKNYKRRPEAAVQFEDIYRKHHDPENIEKRKFIRNREERAESIRQDMGI